MERMEAVEKEFRALHDESVKLFEDELGRWKGGLDEERKRALADEKEIRESLKGSGIDVDLLDRRAKRSIGELDADLEKMRPGLVGRPSLALADWKQRVLQPVAGGDSCYAQVSPYAVSIKAADLGVFENVSGERGGSWILPDNPGKINMRADDRGSGWGCWATAYPPPAIVSVWFHFTPDQTARWEISPILAFHGFYVMRADDGIFSCKNAKARLTARLDIFQYFWKGEKTYKLIDRSDDDVNEVKFYDRTEWIWDTTNLRAGDPVWVKVDLTVEAYASGGGSYAEVNFSDGEANYIEPLIMTVQVV